MQIRGRGPTCASWRRARRLALHRPCPLRRRRELAPCLSCSLSATMAGRGRGRRAFATERRYGRAYSARPWAPCWTRSSFWHESSKRSAQSSSRTSRKGFVQLGARRLSGGASAGKVESCERGSNRVAAIGSAPGLCSSCSRPARRASRQASRTQAGRSLPRPRNRLLSWSDER